MISAALDTSCGTAFAVGDDSGIRVDLSLPLAGRDSDKQLVPWIEQQLSAAGLSWRDVERWTVGTGPGSFSGIRVGIAFVQGVCACTRAVYRGLPSSFAMACVAARDLEVGQSVGVLHDARRNQLILSVYQLAQCGVRALGDPEVITPADCPRLEEYDVLTTVHGDACRTVLPEALLGKLRVQPSVPAAEHLRAGGGDWPSTQAEVQASTEPVYVRPAVFVKPKPVPDFSAFMDNA